jgi:hypothetical protein
VVEPDLRERTVNGATRRTATAALACLVGQDADKAEKGDEASEANARVRVLSAPLERTTLARELALGEEARPRGAPFLVAKRDGSLVIGSVEWTPGKGDRIVLETPGASGTSEPVARRVVAETFGEILDPVAVVDARGRIRLLWTDVASGGPRVMTTCESDARFTPPAPLFALAALHPRAVLHAGTVWVAWEQESTVASGATTGAARGARDVLLAALDEESGALGSPIVVAGTAANELEPSLASGDGRLWIAWTAWTGRDQEVRTRSFDPKERELSDVVEVSADPGSDDHHPSIAVAKNGDAWIAWDAVRDPARGISAPIALRVDPRDEPTELAVRVACVRGHDVLVVGAAEAKTPTCGELPGVAHLSTGGGLPRVCCDGDDRLWIAWRSLEHSAEMRGQEGFVAMLQSLGAKGWSAPIEIERSVGFPEAVALAPLSASSGGIAAAFQCDQRLELLQRRDRHALPASIAQPLREQGVFLSRSYGTTAIGLARASASPGEGNSPLTPRVPERAVPPPAPDCSDDPFVNGERRFEITRALAPAADGTPRDERFLVFWGDLHRHSNVSRCTDGMEPGPEDCFIDARDAAGCDFVALTDHAHQMRASSWWQLDKLAQELRSPGFCTLNGFEWSTAAYGHQNVILADRLAPIVGDALALPRLYERLRPEDCLAIPHRSADARSATDFDAIPDPFVRLVEIYQAQWGSHESDGCFRQARAATALGCFVQDALEQGHRIGFVAGSDHTSGRAYTGVLAPSLDRASLFDALAKRRTIAATTKGLFVDLRVGDAIAGEEVACAAPPHVRLHVNGVRELAEVTVFKNGRIWRSTRSDAANATIANRFAVPRLIVRLPVRVKPAATWSLTVKGAAADPGAKSPLRFELLDDRRGGGREGEAAGWSLDGEAATFAWPAGVGATATTSEQLLHVRGIAISGNGATAAVAGGELTLTTPEGTTTIPIAELLAHPRPLPTPAGECTLRLDAGDAAIDLSKGLGAREFDGEWEETRTRPGTSWYYARGIQVDGEMAWSSPIFVSHE